MTVAYGIFCLLLTVVTVTAERSFASSATGGWPEQEAPNQARIQALLEHYRAVAQRDKLERERRNFIQASAKKLQPFLKLVVDLWLSIDARLY